MSFHEVRFPDDVSYNSAGGPGYNTSIVQIESGHEERVARWTQARRRYDVAYGIKSPAQLHAVQTFYIAREGCLHGFRFKDWLDYTTTASGNSHHSGEVVAATDQTLVAVAGSTTQFQLVKRYTSGGSTKIRYLTKPVAGTVLVAIDGVTQGSGWTIDTTAGVITFSGTPSGVVTAGCEFDVPVRFGKEVDEALMASYQNFGWGDIQSCPLVELNNGLRIAEDANCGMSVEICLTVNYQMLAGVSRFWVFEPNEPGLSVLLPSVADLPPGGPMFWLLNVGPNSVAIVESNFTAFATLAVGQGMVVALTLDGSGNKVWYAI